VEEYLRQEKPAVNPTPCSGVMSAWMAIVLLSFPCPVSGRDFGAKITIATRDDLGFLVHTVDSGYQGAPTKIRVLMSAKLKKDKRYPLLLVLPVEAGEDSHYGDGLREIRKHGLHARHGVVCVQPTFAHLPWYADHPSNAKIQQEKYLLEVVLRFVEKTYPVTATRDGRLLLGFSKSGWGAFSLLLRHPDVFGKAAAWDAPLDMEAPGKYGSGEIFGTRENFAKYQITKLVEKQAGKLSKGKRLGVLGYGNFRLAHEKVHALMERLKIEHQYGDGPRRKHDWHSGWVAEAVECLAGKEPR
jgi:hypothetical protein